MSFPRFVAASAAATIVGGFLPGFQIGAYFRVPPISSGPHGPEWHWLLSPMQFGLFSLYVFWWIALAHILLLALPAYGILVRRSPLRWWKAAVAGAAIATPVALTAALPGSSGDTGLRDGIGLAIIFMASGMLSGLAFWAVMRVENAPRA